MLDGIMQTALTSGQATQQLVASIETVNYKRWWLQGIVPMCIILLYFAALYFTCRLSEGYSTLKELDLSEVIAAQPDSVRRSIHSGLRRSAVGYRGDI